MITNKERVEILKKVRERLQNKEKWGLCALIEEQIRNTYPSHSFSDYFLLPIGIIAQDYFPLFTRKNAILHSNAESTLFIANWWNTEPFDFENRILFIDWLIKQYETKEINKKNI